MFAVALAGSTITHPNIGRSGAGRVMLKPAAPGTGVIAGGAARAILEAAGVHDILAKSLGSSNGINVAHATIQGLKGLKRPDEIAKIRGKSPEEVTPAGVLRAYRESQRGKTAGRGMKGQGARDTVKPWFEGGQLPITQRVPKQKGFKNPFRVEYAVVNLDTLEAVQADEVTPDTLRAQGLVHKHGLVKV